MKVVLFFYLSLIIAVVYKMTKEPTVFKGLTAGLKLFTKLVVGIAACAAVLLIIERFI